MTEQTESPSLLAALWYESLGWGVIPIVKSGKRPLIPSWKEFQTRRATRQEIRQWWTTWPEANVAVITGSISGIVVLDVDGPDGRESLSGKGLPPTPCVKTGKGFHYYYRHPGGVVENNIRLLPGLDVKGDGGYVVAPPSIHENGHVYEWPSPVSPEETPLVEMPGWLKGLLAHIPTQISANGNHDGPTPNGKGAQTDYLELLNGVNEGHRNATATRLTGRLLSKGLPKEEVLLLLTHWNERNSPPLPEEELKEVVDSIADRHAVNHPNLKGSPAPVIFKTPKLFTKSIGEILNGPEPEIDWLVDKLFEKGNIGFIAGEPKLSKSWLALDLLVSLTTGTPFMGNFIIPHRRRVLYIQEEDGPVMIRKRIKLLMAGRGVAQIEDVYCRCSIRVGFKIDNPDWQDALQQELFTFEPDLVIMDVLNKLHTKEENSQQQMTEVMNAVETVRRAGKCSVLIVHHFRKSGGEGKSNRANQRMRGSSVLSGWSENSLYLTGRVEKRIKVEHESKNSPVDPFLYELEDVMEGDDKTGVRVKYIGDAGELNLAEKLNKILRAIEEADQSGDLEARTAKGLHKATGISENTIRLYAKTLEDGKKIRSEKIKLGDRGSLATCYYPLTSSADQGV